MARHSASFLLTMILNKLLQVIRHIVCTVQSWIHRNTGQVVTFDTGKRVRLGRQLAEGGFSFVFEAYDNNDSSKTVYAVKRVVCPEPELIRACQQEAAVHRMVRRHANIMPLLGMSIQQQQHGSNSTTVCYMLFPYYPLSLRAHVNSCIFPQQHQQTLPTRPYKDAQVLQLFTGICRGVQALHEAGYSHRDVKLENILLDNSGNPILMDFGSAGPLQQDISTRRAVLQVVEDAALHTTMAYRPPELFDGGIMTATSAQQQPLFLDYTAVDVWSLGCTLFALLYGASPFECEFVHDKIQIKECTQLSILGKLPVPPVTSDMYKWYSQEVTQLVHDMLVADRLQRPRLAQILIRLEGLLRKRGIVLDSSYYFSEEQGMDSAGEAMSLVNSNGMV